MNHSTPYSLVDAFTDRPFAGNPAAVCVLPAWPAERWLKDVAREMNQPETAFLVANADGFDLRWLTPAVEVDLCGHATLAAAHVLWERGLAPDGPIRFATRSGVLTAARAGGDIELDFPLRPEVQAEAPAGLAEALGVTPRYVGRSQDNYLLVEVEDEAAVRGVAPDFRRLAAAGALGVIVTARSSEPRFDFVSRFFAPAAGVDEDPVTGSAHCCLAAFWRGRLGKDSFVAYQASPRGGVVKVRVAGDRAILGGTAVTVGRGELMAG